MLANILYFLLRLLLYVSCFVGVIAFIFSVIALVSFIKNRQKFKFVPGTYKKQSLLYRLFMFPYMFGYTLATTDPNTFRPHGVILFEGRQGSGKTSALMKYATDLKEQYPLSMIISNTEFNLMNSEISDWHDMLDTKNGVHGLIVILDEIQNWFNSKQSKDFPPECLSYITQLRKERKIVLGTCQQFYMVSKDIRTQVSELRRCHCILGCLNIVQRTRPVVDSEGTIIKYIPLGWYWFVQTPKLRNSYDTYRTVENLSRSGMNTRIRVY